MLPPHEPAAVTSLRRKLGGIAFGGDYNPEQWPEEVWAEDARLMKEAGVNLATVGVFSWAHVQPEPGAFRFDWLDRVLDLLGVHGIAVDLATMTASPPPWLTARHPEILPVRADGVTLSPGARQHFNASSSVYREHAAQLVTALATRYADHPALALWHIGNEYGVHVAASYDDASAAAFRDWLRERYGAIDALNDAWSTTFWSQRYSDFDQILPPRVAPTSPNPAQQLDFARFCDDALLACYRAEREILHAITPDIPATTNFLYLHKPVNVQRWAPHTDLLSVDSYPDPALPDAHLTAGLAYDIIRGARAGQPWLLMEQAPTAVNWRDVNLRKRPGQMRLWSWQAVAHGADAVLYFQWRQSRGGAEKFHSGMVPHAGAGTRAFAEIRELGEELARVPGLAGTRVYNRVALLLDWESWWALELDWRPSRAVDQLGSLAHFYAPLFDAGIGVDVVHPDANLDPYSLVIAPNLYLLRQESALRLDAWVRAGGHLAVSFFSGIVDDCDRAHLGGYPAPLTETLGISVEEFAPLPVSDTDSLAPTVKLAFDDGTEATGTIWSEVVHLHGAQQVASFADGDLSGQPAITRHRRGDGIAWYLATRTDADATRALVQRLLTEADVHPPLPQLPPGVQVSVRDGDGERYVILLNHTTTTRTVPLLEGLAVEVGREDGHRVELPAFGVAVLRGSL
jgi:beta-galactosidase